MIGGEAIGKQVVEHIGSSKAVSLKQHSVLTIGETATAAVKAPVMDEDVAKAVWFALQTGEVMPIDPQLVDKLHDRYMHIVQPVKCPGQPYQQCGIASVGHRRLVLEKCICSESQVSNPK